MSRRQLFLATLLLPALAGAQQKDSSATKKEPDEFWKAMDLYYDSKAYGPAYQQLILAYNKGSLQAGYYLAVMNENGMGGVPKSYPMALRFLTECSDRGNAACSRQAGAYHWNGWGVPEDDAKAAKYFELAVKQGDTASNTFLGRFLVYGLGGVKPDTLRALDLFRTATRLKHPQGMFFLGSAYEEGWGVRIDTTNAGFWYAQAAEYGSKDGAQNAAAIVRDTDGWRSKAYYLLRVQLGDSQWAADAEDMQPARGGNEEYQQALKLFATNKAEAFRLNDIAMKKGNRLAAAAVVEAYQNGYGVRENVSMARQSARVCATMGNDWCQTIMAQYLLSDESGQVDGEGARHMFEQAAVQNNTLAMFMLAELFDKGKEIAQNDALASYWYRAAYDRGSQKAKALLEARGLIQIDPRVKEYFDYMEKGGADKSDVQRYSYEVMVYCKFGGKKCQEFTVEVYQMEKRANSAAASANMSRIWNLYASPSRSDADYRARSDCMRKKLESIEKHTYGQQDWEYTGTCK